MDIQLQFMKSDNKINVVNSQGKKNVLSGVDADLIKVGENKISFEITKTGYIVKVNDKDLSEYNDDLDDMVIETSLTFEKLDTVTTEGLTGVWTQLKISRKE